MQAPGESPSISAVLSHATCRCWKPDRQRSWLQSWGFAVRQSANAQHLRGLAQELRAQALHELNLVAATQEFVDLETLARTIGLAWQRSTSSIEGRNGYLSQKHHDLRGINDRKLACLTHLHNFYARRSDGTTAARRFFGRDHLDLARETIASMGNLKRPRCSAQAA